MAQTLKEYIEEQRKLGATPYFTNIPPEEGGPEDVFRYEEKPFTEQTERELEDPLAGFRYSEDVPGLMPEEPQEFSMAEAEKARKAPPPKPTAETVTPGARVPGEKTARYAMDQRIPEAKEAIPEKPPAEALTVNFKNRAKYEKQVANKIKQEMGYNPLTFNYVEEAAKITKEREPDLFRKTFRGRKAYHMKEFLDPQERKIWRAAVSDDAATTENKLKFTSDKIDKRFKGSMEVFDDKVREKAKLPVAVKNAISPLFITVNEEGKKLGQIPATILPKAIANATRYVNGGMDAAEAVSKVTQELTQQTILMNAQRETETQAKADALAAIQKPGWVTKADIDKARVTSKAALDAGATKNEVKATLLDVGYKEGQVAQIFKPEAPAVTVVSRETPGKKSKVREIKEAFQRGDYGPPESTEARDKAKAKMAQL